MIGEAQQQWAPLRRKYNLYLFQQFQDAERMPDNRQITSRDHPVSSPNSKQLQISQAVENGSNGEYTQFAYVDEPFLSWDFSLRSAESQLIGSVNRNWGGIGRELFTDTGVYALRMDAAGMAQEPQLPGLNPGKTDVVPCEEKIPAMTLDQRAVMLATAVSIDFDYFSRHSSVGGGTTWMPLWFPIGGGEATAAGEAAEGGGAVGEVSEGSIIRQDGPAAGATGMGTMAGYEAMQRGNRQGGDEDDDDASPTIPQEGILGDDESWGHTGPDDDPWGRTPQSSSGKDGGGGGDIGDGGGGGFDIGDFFE